MCGSRSGCWSGGPLLRSLRYCHWLSVSEPQPSRDGRTVVLSAGAAATPTEMVRAADHLKSELAALSSDSVTVSLTGAPGMWSDFNEANKSAMMTSEIISWPVTLAILLLAFGSLVAAGLPLLLTILGLMASAGSLFLITHLFDVSIWSMNFALMFALALGIDYALFIVARFRGAHFGSSLTTRDAVAATMDTASSSPCTPTVRCWSWGWANRAGWRGATPSARRRSRRWCSTTACASRSRMLDRGCPSRCGSSTRSDRCPRCRRTANPWQNPTVPGQRFPFDHRAAALPVVVFPHPSQCAVGDKPVVEHRQSVAVAENQEIGRLGSAKS